MGALFSRTDPRNDYRIPDLNGKVILVTGGNSGLGYETVNGLVRHGAKVYMGARNESRATGAIARLKAEGALDGVGQVEWLPLDLSTPAQSEAGAEEFMRRESRLDVLINNAAVGAGGQYMALVDAKVPISLIVSTNVLGPFVLTNALLPLLETTAKEAGSDVRILTGHRGQPSDASWKDPSTWVFNAGSTFQNLKSYGFTRAGNILFATELQRRLDERGSFIISLSVHPGTVSTDSMEYWFKTLDLLTWLLFYLIVYPRVSPEEGARNSLFAATSPTVRQRRDEFAGVYLLPVGIIAQPSKNASDPQAAKDMWQSSEKMASEM